MEIATVVVFVVKCLKEEELNEQCWLRMSSCSPAHPSRTNPAIRLTDDSQRFR